MFPALSEVFLEFPVYGYREEELRWENMSEESEYEMKYDATRRGTTPQHTTPHLIIFVFEFISRVEENIVDGLIETYRVGFF